MEGGVLAARDIQLVQETVAELEMQGQAERARAVEAVLAVALSGPAGWQPDQAREYLTTAQAASVLGVSDQTIRRWVATGRLEGRRQGGRTLVPSFAVLAHLEMIRDPAPQHTLRSPELVQAQQDWQRFLLSGLPAEKVARQEALHEKMEDGLPLSQAERAEMVELESEIAAAAANQLRSWLARRAAIPS